MPYAKILNCLWLILNYVQSASGLNKNKTILVFTSFQKLDTTIRTVVPFSIILDSSRRDNSEFVVSSPQFLWGRF